MTNARTIGTGTTPFVNVIRLSVLTCCACVEVECLTASRRAGCSDPYVPHRRLGSCGPGRQHDRGLVSSSPCFGIRPMCSHPNQNASISRSALGSKLPWTPSHHTYLLYYDIVLPPMHALASHPPRANLPKFLRDKLHPSSISVSHQPASQLFHRRCARPPASSSASTRHGRHARP